MIARFYHKVPRIATVDCRDTGNRDTMSREGAKRLAANIRAAWKALGHDVTVKVETAFIAASQRDNKKASFLIRSNLIGGLPADVHRKITNGG